MNGISSSTWQNSVHDQALGKYFARNEALHWNQLPFWSYLYMHSSMISKNAENVYSIATGTWCTFINRA